MLDAFVGWAEILKQSAASSKYYEMGTHQLGLSQFPTARINNVKEYVEQKFGESVQHVEITMVKTWEQWTDRILSHGYHVVLLGDETFVFGWNNWKRSSSCQGSDWWCLDNVNFEIPDADVDHLNAFVSKFTFSIFPVQSIFPWNLKWGNGFGYIGQSTRKKKKYIYIYIYVLLFGKKWCEYFNLKVFFLQNVRWPNGLWFCGMVLITFIKIIIYIIWEVWEYLNIFLP